MTILLEQYPIPETGVLEISVQQSINIKITADAAKRKAQFWLVTEVSNLIGADLPTLVVDRQQAVWRVPAWIGFPRQGRLGTVGTVDVDVETGQINNLLEAKAKIEKRAKELARLLPPYRTRQRVPRKYLVTHISPIPQANLLPDEQPEALAV